MRAQLQSPGTPTAAQSSTAASEADTLLRKRQAAAEKHKPVALAAIEKAFLPDVDDVRPEIP